MKNTIQNNIKPNIPKLRFPEFEGEWERKRLGDIAEILGGGTPDTSNKEYWDGDIIWLTPTEIKKRNISTSNRKITKLGLKKSTAKILPKGTLLFTSRATIGDIGIAEKECSTNQGFQSFLPNDNFITEFLYYWINENKKEFIRKASGSTFLEINKTEISKIHSLLPTLAEQKKIATFLTAVDSKLQALKKKKELLEQYKKGVMQKIFSQEIRFKQNNGKNFPDWESKALGEIARITTGSSNRQDSLLNGEFTFFDRSQDIRTSNYFLFDSEAIIVPGEGQEFIPKYFIGKFDLHQRTYAIMDFKKSIGKFLFFYISHNTKHLDSHAVGSTVKSLRLPMFLKMPINLPSIEEQTKIANFLTAIDEKINSCEGLITNTENYKKGLLQQMFV